MKVSELLDSVDDSPEGMQTIIYLNGYVTKHDDKRLRLYKDANNRRNFYILKVEDLRGDVHPWTENELSLHGFVGQHRFRLGLECGAKVEYVSIELHTLGESMAGDDSGSDIHTTECKATSGCANGKRCCTRSDTGGPCSCNDCCIG